MQKSSFFHGTSPTPPLLSIPPFVSPCDKRQKLSTPSRSPCLLRRFRTTRHYCCSTPFSSSSPFPPLAKSSLPLSSFHMQGGKKEDKSWESNVSPIRNTADTIPKTDFELEKSSSVHTRYTAQICSNVRQILYRSVLVAGGCGEGGSCLHYTTASSSSSSSSLFHRRLWEVSQLPPFPPSATFSSFSTTHSPSEGGREGGTRRSPLFFYSSSTLRPPAQAPFFYTKALGAQEEEKGRKADLSPLPRKKEEDQYVLFLRIVSFSPKEDLPPVKAEKSCCMPFHTRKGKKEGEGEKRGEDRKFHGKKIFSWN